MHLILVTLCLTAVAADQRNPQRIFGGTLTNINQYPSIVALLHSPDLSTYIQWCGGSIINDRSLLTAAHCTINELPIRWRVRVGSTWANSGGAVHSIGFIANHPYFNAWTKNNDIAIIRTVTAIALSNIARPSSIAGPNYNMADNQVVWAAGWGLTAPGGAFSQQLRHVQIWTINQAVCRQRYSYIGETITDNMMCSGWLDVGGRDQCQGDSGGPLYHNGVVVGLCSFGNGCGDAYYPGINTRVSRFTSWIQANA